MLDLVTCALAGLWYWWRRSKPGLAALGAGVVLAHGLIAFWHPALRYQRVLCGLDAVPLVLTGLAASMLLRRNLGGRWARAVVLTALAFAAAWTADRFIFFGPLVNAYYVAVPVSWCGRCAALPPVTSRVGLRRSGGAVRHGRRCESPVAGGAVRYYHLAVGPDWRQPFLLSHPVWTMTAMLACASQLHWLYRQLASESRTLKS